MEAEYEYNKSYIDILKEKMNFYNVQTHSVHAFCATFEHQLFSEYERRRHDALKVFEKVLQAAVGVGARSYTFHGDKRSDSFNEIDFKHYLRCLDELLQMASAYNIDLSWENVAWCQTSRPEFIAKVKADAPLLKFTLDIKQARRANIDPKKYIDVMGGRLINVHVNDYNDENSCMLPGRGMFDFKEFFKTLSGIGYKGNAIIEVYRTNFENHEELKSSFEYLQSTI